MIVFGDAPQRRSARAALDALTDAIAGAAAAAPGLARHSALVSALIEAGKLAQGFADAADAAAVAESADGAEGAQGADASGAHAAVDLRRAADAAMALAMKSAAACAASWSSEFATGSIDVGAELARCAALMQTATIETRQPEGYAFYALYPESYLESARSCRRAGRWQVIGVRSIGTSLACMVAVALGAPVPVTVRPVGHPFDRRIAADAGLVDRGVDRYAIVDEGPGLSGSSIAAVARWLGEAGIGEERMHFFVSHGNGPGREAAASTCALWDRARADGRIHASDFDEVIVDAAVPSQRLQTWVEACVGPLHAPLRDIGAGAWRALQGRSAHDLPPAHPWQERRKFIAEAAGGRCLVKFAGLGRIGAGKLACAQSLARAGFVPEPVGLCHGFLIERWRNDATPLPVRPAEALRARVLETVAAYLAFRARSFAAPPGSGASLAALHAMGRSNTEEALGAHLALAWLPWLAQLVELEKRMNPVETDNRLHRWEWLVTADAILKADALDHHAAHDLVGCQDIAWDVAGAIVELELDGAEEQGLRAAMAANGATVDPDLLAFLRLCYPAFQLGYYVEAEKACGDAEEALRLRASADRYRESLRGALSMQSFTPRADAP